MIGFFASTEYVHVAEKIRGVTLSKVAFSAVMEIFGSCKSKFGRNAPLLQEEIRELLKKLKGRGGMLESL